MAELTDRLCRGRICVSGFGGGVTGDEIMAMFGAPVALEDHAVRACMAGWQYEEEGGVNGHPLRRRGCRGQC